MEYKFKGKRRDNSEWVIGNLIDEGYILQYIDLAESWTPLTSDHKVTCRAFEVIPETVGQFVCISKLGENIYEGDIIKHGESIRFIEKRGSNYLATRIQGTETILLSFCDNPIVIGNIHDNPEQVNPAVKDSVTNKMYNTDPAAKQPDELKAEQATELESATQDQAMEVDSEEGNTEG